MAQGRKSEATKKRDRLIAAGMLAPTRETSKNVAAGLRSAATRHGEGFLKNYQPILKNYLPPQGVAQVRADVSRIARSDAAACARFLGDLALGRGDYAGAPLRERRQAARDVLELAGVQLQSREIPPDERPLNELTRAELDTIIRKAEMDIKRAGAEDAEIIEQRAGA